MKIDKKGIAYLKKTDKKLGKLIDSVGNIEREIIPNPFIALINSIVFQQLSYKAAITIWNRFENLVGEVNPQSILEISDENLRSCGLSGTKISYIKNISKAMIDKDIDLENIENISDEEIINMLVKIKGIGVWTAEMFLIFCLNRNNVMAYKDLGIRKGLKWLYNLKEEPTIEEFNKIKNKWSPFNTIATLYLWEITIRDYFKYNSINDIYIEDLNDNYVGYIDSPIGIVEIKATHDSIISLDFVEEKRYDEKSNEIIRNSKNQLIEYFEGNRKEFDINLKTSGTVFQNTVWNELIKIPYGTTLSYGDVANNIGNKNAQRAVGNANNKNKIAIIIPCHRVVGSSGKLVGYEGGLWRKEWLLNHEKSNSK